MRENIKTVNQKSGFYARYRSAINKVIYLVLMCLLSLFIVYPIIWTVASSFKELRQIYSESPINLIPNPFTLKNYTAIFKLLPVWRMTFNGLFLAVIIPFFSLVVTSMSAFALARLRFKGNNIIFLLLMSTMMIPSCVTLIPNFMIVVRLGMNNSFLGVILPGVLGGGGISLLLFRQYFMSIPRDLENAMIIDGGTWFGIYGRMVIPNSKPVIAIVTIILFRNTWNSYVWPLIVLKDFDKFTMTIGLKFLSDQTSDWGQLMAGATMTLLPILILYVCFQKYFVNSNLGAGFSAA